MERNAILICIALQSLILIPIPEAHGYGFMIFIDLISVATVVKKLIFSEKIYYEWILIIIGLISIFGKIILIISLFKNKRKQILRMIGLLMLITSWIILFYYNWDFGFLTILTLGFSIPFLMYFGRVIYLMTKPTKI